MRREMRRSASRRPSRSMQAGGSLALPGTGLLERWQLVNGVMTATIGSLSADDYLSIRPELRSIFFSAPSTKYDDATIIANITASPYLNVGIELVGSVTKGYALYQSGSSMYRAYRYFGVYYYVATALALDWADGGSVFVYSNEWSDGGLYEYSI